MSGKDIQYILGRIGFWALILLILFFIAFPFYWAFATSLKTERELFAPAELVPSTTTGSNYQPLVCFDGDNFVANAIRGVLDCDIVDEDTGEEVPVQFNSDFFTGLQNSAIVSFLSVLIALVAGSFAAYALGRIEFTGRMPMLYAVLAMTMFPQISILSGLFNIVSGLGAFGSINSLILTYPLLTLPFTVWVLTSFFQGLPAELEQAALVDGATPFQTFWRILLPLTAPALVTTGLLAFIAAWHEYLFALTFTTVNPEAKTVTVAIAQFSGQQARQEPIAEIMAASIVVTIPLLILVLIFQNRIAEGLTAGAVKG